MSPSSTNNTTPSPSSSPSSSLKKRIYPGTFIHTPSLDTLSVLEYASIGVNEVGVIDWIEREGELDSDGDATTVVEGEMWEVSEREGVDVEGYDGADGCGFYFPGFVGA